jgi:hypothetical protein
LKIRNPLLRVTSVSMVMVTVTFLAKISRTVDIRSAVFYYQDFLD